MIIRAERRGEEAAIFELTQQAFKKMPYSSGTEGPIINQLRKDDDLTLSLVAEQAGQIIAHIAFSPVTIGDPNAGWFGLGPVSVAPSLQRHGIGHQIITEGLSRLKQDGAAGCALIGNPDYYARFGFRSDGELLYGDTPPAFVQWLSFGEDAAKGLLRYAPAFEGDYNA